MNTLDAILLTLNSIEVKGRDNLDKLLGVILAIEAIKKAQETPKEEEADG
jgi:hypothetical protein